MANIVKHLPNSITCLNLLSGTLAVVCAFQDEFDKALICILLAAVFDFLDGFAARLFKAYSDIGKELDSLADTVSFGVAPALIYYNYLDGFSDLPEYFSLLPLLIAAFAALRLAKFNLDTRQTENFLGLPVPAAGLAIASMVALANHYPLVVNSLMTHIIVHIVIVAFVSFLMVSEVPMFSFKFKSIAWRLNSHRYMFIIIIIPVSAAIYFFNLPWSAIVFFILTLYIFWNCITSLKKKHKSE